MAWYFFIFIFLGSCFLLSWLSSRLVKSLVSVAQYLGLREFIVAFFVMGFAASLPNLFIDLPAALQHLPQISFGDIIGGNLIDLTLAMAVVVFFSKKPISTNSNMIQGSALFTFLIAVLPIFLISTGRVTRIDGVILIATFFVYAYWLFSKDGRYKKIYNNETKQAAKNPKKAFFSFLKNLTEIIILMVLLLFASEGVINSAKYFSSNLGVSLSLVGVLIVALGNCFPETYFGLISARKGEGWMIIGDMMGSVIICATLVLGIIAIVSPFEIKDISSFLIARIFTIIAALLFVIFIKTDRKLTKKEALLLLSIYIVFLITEIFVK